MNLTNNDVFTGLNPIPERPDSMANLWDSLPLGDGSGKLMGIPSGLHTLDDMLSGLHSLAVITGQPGTGKTSLGAWVAVQVAQKGYNVLFISAEMGQNAGALYILRAAKGHSVRDLRTDGKKLVQTLPDGLENICVVGPDEKQLAPDSLAALVSPFDFVLVDSLHTLPAVSGNGEYDSINRWMAAFAGATNPGEGGKSPAIWLIAQGTKAADAADEAGIHDGRGSASIGYVARVLIRLEADKSTAKHPERDVTARVVKNSYAGEIGAIDLIFTRGAGQWETN